MSKDEFISYVKDQYREIFGDKYDDARANESANRLLEVANGYISAAKTAADAVIARTKAKMTASAKRNEEFDSMPEWVCKLGEKNITIKDDGKVLVDGVEQDWKVDLTNPMTTVVQTIKAKLAAPTKSISTMLSDIKGQLFDAPKDVKRAFNVLCNYFSKE